MQAHRMTAAPADYSLAELRLCIDWANEDGSAGNVSTDSNPNLPRIVPHPTLDVARRLLAPFAQLQSPTVALCCSIAPP